MLQSGMMPALNRVKCAASGVAMKFSKKTPADQQPDQGHAQEDQRARRCRARAAALRRTGRMPAVAALGEQ